MPRRDAVDGLTAAGVYGTGLAQFVVVGLPGRFGGEAYDRVRDLRHATCRCRPAPPPCIGTGLLTVLVVAGRPHLPGGRTGRTRGAANGSPPTWRRPHVITTRDLTKTYGRLTAVDGVDLEVRGGRPVRPARAERHPARPPWCGCCSGWSSPPAARSRCSAARCRAGSSEVLPSVGAMVEGPGAYPHLSGRTNLRLLDAAGPGGARRDRDGPDRRRAGTGRPGRCRPAAGPGVLAGHAAAARPGRRAAAQAAPARAGRADQRPGPARHPGDPRPAHRAERGRHHGVPVQPPAGRDRAVLHPGRRDGPRPAGAAGRARRAARADRPGAAQHAGAGPGGRAARRPGGGPGRAPADRAPRRPGRAERRAGRRRHPGHRDRAPSGARWRRSCSTATTTSSDRVDGAP